MCFSDKKSIRTLQLMGYVFRLPGVHSVQVTYHGGRNAAELNMRWSMSALCWEKESMAVWTVPVARQRLRPHLKMHRDRGSDSSLVETMGHHRVLKKVSDMRHACAQVVVWSPAR